MLRVMSEGHSAPDQEMLRVSRTPLDRVVAVLAAGEVDLATGPRLRAELAGLLEQVDAKPVVVDLTEVTFLGSTGIAVLVDAHWQAVQLGIPFKVVVRRDSPVEQALRTSGVEQHLSVAHDLNSAVNALAAGS
jgi:anti-sigma B factor antagonist